MSADQQFQQRMGRVETLLERIEGFADPAEREVAREVIQTLMELHGAGLANILDLVRAAGAPGQALIDAFARDEVVAALLLLYGLHPVDLTTRVRAALDQVRPALRRQGGDAELIGIRDGVVRLRLTGSCDGCPSSAATLKRTVEEAVYAVAPDAVALEIEGVTSAPDPPSRLVSLPLLGT